VIHNRKKFEILFVFLQFLHHQMLLQFLAVITPHFYPTIFSPNPPTSSFISVCTGKNKNNHRRLEIRQRDWMISGGKRNSLAGYSKAVSQL
jgi:hypothetical protein